jgi:hypothetical protein
MASLFEPAVCRHRKKPGTHMDSILNTSVNLQSTSVEPLACATIRKIMAVPPTWTNVALVAAGVKHCLDLAIDAMPSLQLQLSAAMENLDKFAEKANEPATPWAIGMWGLHTAYPAWTMFASVRQLPSQDVALAMGYLSAQAYLAGERIDTNTVVELKRALNHRVAREITEGELEAVVSRVRARAFKRLERISVAKLAGAPLGRISQRVNVLGCLAARLGYKFGSGDASFATSKQLTPLDLHSAIRQLLAKLESGCSNSLQTLLSFCIGLPWHLCRDVQITYGDRPQAEVVWIDAGSGLIFTDLSETLKTLGAATHRSHLETSLLLVRPLPQSIAELLQATVARNPLIQRVSDFETSRSTSRRKLNMPRLHWSDSLAQMLASAPAAALKATGRKDLAALCTLGFGLITKADLHYLVFKNDEIFQACDDFYRAIGMGPAIEPKLGSETHFGSRRTPDEQWIKDTFEAAAKDIKANRCGRRYTLNSLCRHHNSFAQYIYLLLQFVSGARHTKHATFSAMTWQPEGSFGLIEDKPVGKYRGLVPLPIPLTIAHQLKLWHAHLYSLARRIEKLQMRNFQDCQARIATILRGDDINLLFTINEDGIALPIAAKKVFVGRLKDMNPDFARHYWPGKLMQLQLSFEDAQVFLRHEQRGLSRDVFAEPQWHVLQRLATGIDQGLRQLGIHAQVGLCKEVA